MKKVFLMVFVVGMLVLAISSEFVADAKALTIKDSSGKVLRYGVDSLYER